MNPLVLKLVANEARHTKLRDKNYRAMVAADKTLWTGRLDDTEAFCSRLDRALQFICEDLPDSCHILIAYDLSVAVDVFGRMSARFGWLKGQGPSNNEEAQTVSGGYQVLCKNRDRFRITMITGGMNENMTKEQVIRFFAPLVNRGHTGLKIAIKFPYNNKPHVVYGPPSYNLIGQSALLG